MTDLFGILIANTTKMTAPGRLTSDPRFWWTTGALMAALLLGAVIFAVLDRWRRQTTEEEPVSAGDQLSHFRSLYDRGELSREEFERIRAKLGGKMRKELQLPEPPGSSGPSSPGPEPGGNGQKAPSS